MAGSGSLLVLVGVAGSGKTAMAAAVADEARRRGFDVLRASPAEGRPGRLVWAQLLRDTGAPDSLVAGLPADGPGPLDLDAAARRLVSLSPRLIVVDDVHHSGADAVEMLSVIGARCVTAPTAVIATAATPLGLGRELRLGGLSEEELVAALGGLDVEAGHALWLASRGLPGVAQALARELADHGGNDDPVVHLALRAASTAVFLDIDASLVRLLEEAAERADGDGTRARVLARLAGELLGDASAENRRRELADEALTLARRAGNPGTLAEVLDARLHALWDPAGAEDRLAAGSEIIDLARAGGDDRRERRGQFWRFVALMELGRVAEAESALAAFEREAATAGDPEAAVMVTARHAMLAVLRGRFERASELIEDVASMARRAGLADTEALTGTLAWSVLAEQGGGTSATAAVRRLVAGLASTGVLNGTLGLPVTAEQDIGSVAEATVRHLLAAASRQPGHFFEATAARMLVWLGRAAEASAELDRLLPRALTSSGPRWLGAMADLAVVAVAVGNTGAAVQLYEALVPYRGQLVVWAGANTCWGPVSHYLGMLATAMGRTGEAVRHFEDATDLEQQAGALPSLAHSLSGLADALTAQAAAGDAERASEHRRRAREIAERLDMTALMERLVPPADEWTLTRDGDDWLLEAGDERARLRDGRGLHHLRALLAAPGRDIRALDLVAGGAGLAASGMGPVLDTAARGAYQRRLDALTASLDAADRAGDLLAAERAEAERQALLGELRRAAGLGGRDRVAAPEAERARVNVTRTLRATIERLAPRAPRAAAHLRASIRTGGACRYEPAPGGPSRWHV
jgi:tetratricopeptide (TPR) repeat protein